MAFTKVCKIEDIRAQVFVRWLLVEQVAIFRPTKAEEVIKGQ